VLVIPAEAGIQSRRVAAAKLEKAIATVIKEGKVATYDVKGRDNNPNSTLEVAEEVARKL